MCWRSGERFPRIQSGSLKLPFRQFSRDRRPYPLSPLPIRVSPSKSISSFCSALRSGLVSVIGCGPSTPHITASAPVLQRYTQPTTLHPSVPIQICDHDALTFIIVHCLRTSCTLALQLRHDVLSRSLGPLAAFGGCWLIALPMGISLHVGTLEEVPPKISLLLNPVVELHDGFDNRQNLE